MTRVDKQYALRLRLQGKTYGDIRKLLPGISKSTLSLWLKDLVLSEDTKRAIKARSREKSMAGIQKSSQERSHSAMRRARETRRIASSEIGKLSTRETLILGAALYWAEGYKRPIVRGGKEKAYHCISFTNSDLEMAKVFLKFLVTIGGVDRAGVRANLRIFQHQNEREMIEYWSKGLEIPRENFTKAYLGISRSSEGKRPFNRLPYGTIQIRISNTDLFHRIMGWIDGLKLQA